MTEADIPLYVCMALIAQESSGNPSAVNGSFRGLLQIGNPNASDIKDAGIPRNRDQFDGRDPNIQPLGVFDAPALVANPELVAAENSIQHFFEYLDKYRRRIGGDPFRMAMCWKAGPGAVRRFNEAVGTPDQVIAFSPEGVAYFTAEQNNSGTYLQDTARLFPEAQEKLGQTPTTVYSPSSGRAISSSAATSSPYESSTNRPTTSVPRSPGCKPAYLSRHIPPSSARMDLAQQAQTKMLQATEINYVESIKYYLSDSAARASISRRGYTQKAISNIQTFLQSVEDDDNSGVAQNLRAAFAFVPSNFVKPLEVFEVRQPFGQARNRLPDGTAITRRHLGVDLETRDPDEVARKAKTSQFAPTASTPPTNLFGQKAVYAIADGEVITAGLVGKYGLAIYIAHAGGVTSRYAHLSQISVANGATVTKGEIIGVSGTTEEKEDADGNGTGRPDHSAVKVPHLHFEIRVNIGALRGVSTSLASNTQNVALDPAAVLAQAPGPLDPPVVAARPEESALEEGRAVQASLLVNSATDHGRLKSAEAYDAMSSQVRSQAIRNMKRSDYYDEQSRVAPISRNVQEQSVSLDPQIHAAYAAEPLASTPSQLPPSETGIAGIAGVEQEVTTERVNDQFDRNTLAEALDGRIVTLNASLAEADTIEDSNLRRSVTASRQSTLDLVSAAYNAIINGEGDVIAQTIVQGGLSADLLLYKTGATTIKYLQYSDGKWDIHINETVTRGA
jgi:hypothetical protein